ncbi:helix-turn-helix domain-containing protein [uncultured Paludibaculum sp.]|uniref:helix-turn-helix transcriptional regulator n=1 Tax=uncultured Paludibaculum sp. TaxID=1765020 RepID=UPI002AAB7568|nr:helix-turn-helix domain-containing protein [uncultured Paludibaculum sp.]
MIQTRHRKPLPPASERRWRTVDEVAALLGCSRSTVQRFTSGLVPGVPRLPSVPRGTRARIWHVDAVEAWLSQVQSKPE